MEFFRRSITRSERKVLRSQGEYIRFSEKCNSHWVCGTLIIPFYHGRMEIRTKRADVFYLPVVQLPIKSRDIRHRSFVWRKLMLERDRKFSRVIELRSCIAVTRQFTRYKSV